MSGQMDPKHCVGPLKLNNCLINMTAYHFPCCPEQSLMTHVHTDLLFSAKEFQKDLSQKGQ